MRKIGYIFKYSANEKIGILVYGQWCSQREMEFACQHIKLMDRPIRFSSSACIDNIKTGSLVYFKLVNGTVYDIERASLSNFDKSLIAEYYQNSFIVFEHIYDKDSEKVKDGIYAVLGKYTQNFSNDIDFNDDCRKVYEYYDIVNGKFIQKMDLSFNYMFPKSIDEFYECFGKYGHEKRYETIRRKRKIKRPRRDDDNSVVVDIFDISLWIDEGIISQQDYFGRNLEEIQFLYDLFIQRIGIDRNGYKQYAKKQNDGISPLWTLLLSKLANDDLRKIMKVAPKLQPALPIEFCNNNLDVLDDKYGMPTKDLCKDYCAYKVNTASTATDYKEWSQKLYVFANCNTNHLPDEGVPMCSMGKGYIVELEKILEKNYIDHIEISIKNSLNSFLGTVSLNSENELLKTELLDIGVFLDVLNTFKTFSPHYSATRWSYRFEKIVESYNSLEKKLRAFLLEAWANFVNESLLELSSKEDLSPLSLGMTVELAETYINGKTKSEIKVKVNDKFSKISNFSDLKYAFEYGYISENQFLNILKRLTANFTTTQFARLITKFCSENGYIHFYELPIDCQRFVLNRIVDVYGAKELHKGESVRISDYNGFCNLESFIRWLTELKSGQYGEINNEAIDSAISKAIEPLNEQDIKSLFNKRYLVKSGDPIETILSKYCDQVMRDMEYQNYRDSLYDDDSDGQYSGSWAHDVEGYSYDDIDTIFDGDPDAYWNID